MSIKRKVLTKKEQNVVIDILEELIIANAKLPENFYTKIMDRYNLTNDPFTGMPCTIDDYCKNQLEYDKQVMIEKYGHCDGLE